MSRNKEAITLDVNVKMCLQDIVKYDLLVKACIQDIRDCTGPLEVLNILNMKVGENIRILKNCLEELEKLSNEYDKEEDRKRILDELENHHKQLTSNQFALRKANLDCQMRIDKNNKTELFRRPANVSRKRADKESLTKTASGITDNLVSISKMMASQVKQSEDTLHSLVNSSSSVGDTNEELKNMGNVIHQSRKLLTKYNRRELTDKVLIFLALAFFFACVLYVLKKRLF
ncbi:vesicle transport protein SEC20 [Centruroides vittatus]|uniref:vesicle transport protein SEC20 n=1 Tax=Centruroides vittatus TaxID=120091 RepID=UPI0035105775